MKFSFIFPTRGHRNLLVRTLGTIVTNTYDLRNIEVLIAVDEDDKEMCDFKYPGINFIKHIVVREKDNFAKYYNFLAKRSTGDVIWVWSDENLLATPNWDVLATKIIRKSGWDVWYGRIVDVYPDGTAWVSPITKERFSCFPMISRKAYEALGFIHTPKLRIWGADLYMFMLFERNQRVLDMNKIEIVSSESNVPERINIYNEDINKLVDAGIAKRVGAGVEYDISADSKKLRNAIGIPRFYRLDMLK